MYLTPALLPLGVQAIASLPICSYTQSAKALHEKGSETMKIIVEHEDLEENEIILRCARIDDEMLQILTYLKSHSQKLCAFDEQQNMMLLSPDQVYYCESVDERVFLYGSDFVYRTAFTLSQLESFYADLGFIRISKAMVVNLYKIKSLKSYTSGRIALLMHNNENIIVSRKYAVILRQRLEVGGKKDA